MKFQARLIDQGHVKGVATLQAPDLPAAEREAAEGLDVLAGQWVELQPLPEEGPERADLMREAVESLKHPENVGAG